MQIQNRSQILQAILLSTVLFSQGCFPPILENTNQLIVDSDELVNHADEQLVLTAEQLRENMATLAAKVTETLGKIDELEDLDGDEDDQ